MCFSLSATARVPDDRITELKGSGMSIHYVSDGLAPINSTSSIYDEVMGVAVGALSTALIILVIFVVMCFVRQRRK